MAKSKTIVLTKNKEIYNKLNSLIFSQEIIIDNTKFKKFQLDRIIKNINKNSRSGDVLESENLDKWTIIKKLKPINFSIYFKT